MHEVRPGVWHWQARHPEWTADEPWAPEVSSYAIDDGTSLVFFDPQGLPSGLEQLVASRTPAIVLMSAWHERDSRALVERFDPPPPVFVPRPGEGSPDVAWLLGDDALDAHVISPGDPLPLGAVAYPGRKPNDLVLWIESHRTVLSGDTLVDFGDGLHIHDDWLWGTPRRLVVDTLRPLLDLPVELVLPTHGQPTDRAALERALA